MNRAQWPREPGVLVLRPLTDRELAEVYRRRMTRDFPPQELKPLNRMREQKEQGIYACWGFFQGESLRAYAMVSSAPDCPFGLLDYFAVVREARGRGLGTQALRMLTDRMQGLRGMIVETEDPDDAVSEEDRAVRERRIAFYERAGARRTQVRVLLWGVRYRALALPAPGDQLADVEVKTAMERLYRAQFPEALYQKCVRFF